MPRRFRPWLEEARVLTRYVHGSHVRSGVLRRYVRAVRAEEDSAPLDLSGPVRAWPPLLRALEPVGGGSNGNRLRRRLELAVRIVEMTPGAAGRFHDYRGRPWWIAWPALALLLAIEALLLPLRWLAGRFVGSR